MHRCVSVSSENVPSKFCCSRLQGGSDTLFARIHRKYREVGLPWKSLILCDNFSFIILQTSWFSMQKSIPIL